MKIFEKFRKQNDTAEKQPKLNSILLQTYFTSLFSLVLCVTLFFGTSYAWFTSEVSNTTNEIYVGTLAVGLHSGGNKSRSLTDADNKLFSQDVRWEPGYTTLDILEVTNEGDLAFKYELSFTDGALTDSKFGDVASAAENFEVWYFDHQKYGVPAPSSYGAINEGNNWKYAGGLDELLEGKIVLSGQMENVRGWEEGSEANKGTTDGIATTHTYTLALHMKEDANADIMGTRISLNVKLVAYQLVSETDAMGNATYDDVVTATDAQTLKKALEDNTHVLLTSDVVLENPEERLTMYAQTLDGNNNTIEYNGGRVEGVCVGALTTTGGKISNAYISGAGDSYALYAVGLDTDLVVSDCVLSGENAFKLEAIEKNGNALLSFVDTSFADPVVCANVVRHVYFNGCTIEDALIPSGDMTLTDCVFESDSLDVSQLKAGETVTLINCSYNGLLIEKAVVVSDGESAVISGTGDLQVSADKMVVLNG